MIGVFEYTLKKLKFLHQSVETPKGLLGAMVARLTSISSSHRIRHQEVAGSSPAVVGSLGRFNPSLFALLYTLRLVGRGTILGDGEVFIFRKCERAPSFSARGLARY
jgi:hypothetical protein